MIKVIQPGLLTTIQDLGRHGYQKWGINVSGAMDSYSLKLANILVGNPKTEAGLEITLRGPKLEFLRSAIIALTGGDLSPSINGKKIKMNTCIKVEKGSILQFGKCISGCRAYLAVGGEFSVPEVMGSKSTYIKGKMGGLDGRLLQKGDILPIGNINSYAENLLLDKEFKQEDYYIPYQVRDNVLRITKGLQYAWFTEESLNRLTAQEFRLGLDSDRMGYRLEGDILEKKEEREMVSEIAVMGTVQVPSSGQPILLMADHQSVGGYPKIAQVIKADLKKAAQLKPGDKVCFEWVSLEKAEGLLIEQEKYLERIKEAIEIKQRGR